MREKLEAASRIELENDGFANQGAKNATYYKQKHYDKSNSSLTGQLTGTADTSVDSYDNCACLASSPDLVEIVGILPKLPANIRAGIVAMIKAIAGK